jgi:hypothetical protein
VRKDEVGLMRGIVILVVTSPSDVISRVSGVRSMVCRTALPFTHRQDSRNQNTLIN